MTSGVNSDPVYKKMCEQESQLTVKAEMKVCHVSHMDAFQETDSADTHTHTHTHDVRLFLASVQEENPSLKMYAVCHMSNK